MKLITEGNFENVIVLVEEKAGRKTLYIEGVFLQAEVKNRNGRIYPFDVLKNEVNRYTEQYVNPGRALGELGHPCLSGDAKLLSIENGWKHIENCVEGEKVYTLNPKTKEIEINPIKKVIINHHKGIIYNFKNRGINTKVTPDHRFLIINSRNHTEYKFVTAQEIFDDFNENNKFSKWYIPKYSFGLNIDSPNEYIIPCAKKKFKLTDKTTKYLFDLSINFHTFSAFLGLYLSEGSCSKKPNNSFHVSICQNEGFKADKIREILYSIEGLKWTETKTNEKVVWNCYDRRLGEYLIQFGNCYEKYVPKDFISKLDSETARIFLDYFILGDGRGNINEKYNKCDAFSVSKKLIDDISQIAIIAGIGISRHEEICEHDYIFADRVIKKENKSILYFCRFLNTKGIYLDKRHIEITTEDWNDNVYCIQVDNTNFMVEQNGYSYWTGNCGPTVNLDRVSHKIVSLKAEGNNFIGKAQILSTPMGEIAKSLLDSGVMLGVSSRGMGSVQEKNGANYVQNDFMLATAADIVADPSAPDAFVNGIMENKEWIWDNGLIKEVEVSKYKKYISESTKQNLEERSLKAFNHFLQNLQFNK